MATQFFSRIFWISSIFFIWTDVSVAEFKWTNNPPMDQVTAKRTQAENIGSYRKNCVGRPFDVKCTNYVAMILYSSAVLGQHDLFQKYLDEYRGTNVGDGNTGCSYYLQIDDRRKVGWHIDRFAALVYIQDKKNYEPTRSYAINAYLCTVWQAWNKPSQWLSPPAPDYPSRPAEILAVTKRRLGEKTAATLERFQAGIIDPYFSTLQSMFAAELKRTNNKVGSKYYSLALELAKNAKTQTEKEKYPKEYQEFMEGVVADARYMVDIVTKNENYRP